MQIIPASVKDENDIKTLLGTCGLPSDDLRSSHLESFFVIQDSNQIVGSVGLEICGEFGLLRSLALSKSLRGRGKGTQLVEYIEEYARSQKIKSIYLLTTTADQFFIRLGYQTIMRENAPEPVQDTAEFRSICPDSAVCMFKKLK
jgi:amino-acid N-acetyltransferase